MVGVIVSGSVLGVVIGTIAIIIPCFVLLGVCIGGLLPICFVFVGVWFCICLVFLGVWVGVTLACIIHVAIAVILVGIVEIAGARCDGFLLHSAIPIR